MEVNWSDDEKELEKDEDGDWEYRLAVDHAGRSALDVATDGKSAQDELQKMVQDEFATLSKYHPLNYTWSLTQAAKHGDLAAVRRLVKAGAEIHVKDEIPGGTNSAIREATRKGHSEVVDYLLEAEKNRMLHSGYTPELLESAVQDGQHEEVARLLKEKIFLERSSSNKNDALREAAENGNLQLMQLLIESGARADATGDYHPRTTALEFAAKNGHLESVKYLLSHGAITKPYNSHPSALKLASAGGFLEIVEELLRAGAGPNDDNALHAAAFGGHLKIVQRLLEAGAGVDVSNEYENSYREGHLTALQEAARGGHLSIVETLLQEGADVNALPRDRGMTALQAAAASGSVEVVKRLVAAGANVNAPAEEWKRTALQAASEVGSMDIVNILLDAGAVFEKSASVNGDDSPALELAIKGGHISVAERLLQNMDGMRVEEQEHQYLRDPRTLALHAAAFRGYEQIVRRLLDGGAPISELDHPCLLVPHTASKGHSSVVRLLLDAGAEMDGNSSRYSRTSHSQTALQSAVQSGHIETARLLLAYGADVNAAPARVKSPLHLACRNQDVAMAQLLLDAGADIYAVSYSGKTVRQSAEKGSSAEILQLLNKTEAMETTQRKQEAVLDVSQIPIQDLCSTCSVLPLELFANKKRSHDPYEFHQSLISLRDSARNGCPFCVFFCKQLGLRTIAIPKPSIVRLYQSFGSEDGENMWSQIDEPHPKDVESPQSLRVGFQVCVEPFQEKRQALPGDTNSPGTFQQIENWLRQCTECHPICNFDFEEAFVPTRLVDLSNWHNERTLTLVESRSIEKHSPLYIALSHRWDGQVTAATSTTSKNIDTRLQSLTVETLPLTFIHAIEVGHKLKIKYLWIDSLCIIQDSAEDWNRESSLMGKVYRNSYLTISAQVSEASSSGFFRSENVQNDSVEFQCNSKDGQSKIVRAVKSQPSWIGLVQQGPLQSRGWCLQERELSPRVLHYTPSQVLWECRAFKATEGWPTRDISHDLDSEWNKHHKRILDTIKGLDVPEVYNSWHHTVAGYSARCLTKCEDTMPALGGLARIVNEYVKSEYVAGIWAGDLQRSLAWVSKEYHPNSRHPPSRHAQYVAPSWSWASVSGIIDFSKAKDVSVDNISEKGTVVVDSYNIELLTSDPFGQISSGELHITAPMLNAVLDYYSAASTYFLRGPQDSIGQWYGQMTFDVLNESENLKVVRCICLFRNPKTGERGKRDEGIGLALVPVEGKENTYRRVGHIWSLGLAAFQDLKEESFILV